MKKSYNIMILGASYGSLLAIKFLLAGHNVKLLCRTATAELINKEGVRVRIPVRGLEDLVEISSEGLPGKLTAATPSDVDPKDFDLIGLAMQEPQYSAPDVAALLHAIGKAKVPCMSIMNMPPLPYMARLPGIDASSLTHCYADPDVWSSFDPDYMTLCSPDPQAFRPPEEKANVLQVRLPTNFKVAKFDIDGPNEMLETLEADVDAIRFDVKGTEYELPVKLRVFDSIFVPLAKWSMLMTGNYRCVQKDDIRPIKDAVHGDIEQSRQVYNWVVDLCKTMGADADDMVPFEKYANAATGLANPSSAARALVAGSVNIERVDSLVKAVASQRGIQSDTVDEIVGLVDGWLAENRKKSG